MRPRLRMQRTPGGTATEGFVRCGVLYPPSAMAILSNRRPALIGAFFGALVVTLHPAPLLPGKPGDHDEDPHEPEQREEGDAPDTPIDCAEHVQAQADQTRRAEDSVDASVNSHRVDPLDVQSRTTWSLCAMPRGAIMTSLRKCGCLPAAGCGVHRARTASQELRRG